MEMTMAATVLVEQAAPLIFGAVGGIAFVLGVVAAWRS